MRRPTAADAKRWAHWTFIVLGALVLFADGLCGVVVLAVGHAPVSWLGNTPELLVQAASGPPEFRFAVLGDTQKGLAGSARLIKAIAAEKPAFFVHTGDLVSHNDEGHYILARWHVFKSGATVPFLVVPGNHDVKGGDLRFERYFGPRQFTFGRGIAAFHVVNDALDDRWSKPGFEDQLAESAGRKILVFMHVPPWDTTKKTLVPTPGWEEFFDICRRKQVAYVICGHAHGYSRIEDHGTIYIANGIGGDSDSWQYDERAMATIIDVGRDSVTDRPFEVPPAFSLWAEVEHLALGHVSEAYRSRPLWTWSATAALAWLWGWAVLRRPRRRRSIEESAVV